MSTINMDAFVIRRKRVANDAAAPISDVLAGNHSGLEQHCVKQYKTDSDDSDMSNKKRKLDHNENLSIRIETFNQSSPSDKERNQRSPSESQEPEETGHVEMASAPADVKIKFRKIKGEGLDCDYGALFCRKEADELLKRCEEELTYIADAKVRVFGRWHDIPRKQVAHGDAGLGYNFSGKTVHAKPWNPLLATIRDRITMATGHQFNFVLINRYADGNDYIGPHKDDEKDLDEHSPIASVSLGQHRDFVFTHGLARGKDASRKDLKPVTLELEHGCLLMMNYPTNKYWYHSLPKRKKALGIRINMTFRKMVVRHSH